MSLAFAELTELPPPPRSSALAVAGGITLRAAWLPAAAAGGLYAGSSQDFGAAWGFLPVFGPFGWALSQTELDGSGVEAIVVAEGLDQLSGAAMLVGGLVAHGRPMSWVPTVRLDHGLEPGAAGTF